MVVGKMRYVREFSAFMKGLIRYPLDSFKVLDSVLTHGAHRVLVSWCPGGLIHCQVVTTPVFVPIIQYCAKKRPLLLSPYFRMVQCAIYWFSIN